MKNKRKSSVCLKNTGHKNLSKYVLKIDLKYATVSISINLIYFISIYKTFKLWFISPSKSIKQCTHEVIYGVCYNNVHEFSIRICYLHFLKRWQLAPSFLTNKFKYQCRFQFSPTCSSWHQYFVSNPCFNNVEKRCKLCLYNCRRFCFKAPQFDENNLIETFDII